MAPGDVPVRPRADALGIVALVIAALAFLPFPLLLLAGFVPALDGIGWYGLLVLPAATLVAGVALILSIVGVVAGTRARRPVAASVVALVVAVSALAPGLFVLLVWWR